MAHEKSHAVALHPSNSDGPFYVANGECISCGALELEASLLMSHDETGHCFFARQPAGTEETNAAILPTWASCCGAIRYAGQERETLVRLAELGLGERCDFRLRDEPKPVTRNYVTFNFTETTNSEVPKARQIIEHFAGFLSKYSGRVLELRHTEGSASFGYEWDGVNTDRFSVVFLLEPRGQKWLLRILREDDISATAFGIAIDKVLRSDARFSDARWFTEEDWLRDQLEGSPRLY